MPLFRNKKREMSGSLILKLLFTVLKHSAAPFGVSRSRLMTALFEGGGGYIVRTSVNDLTHKLTLWEGRWQRGLCTNREVKVGLCIMRMVRTSGAAPCRRVLPSPHLLISDQRLGRPTLPPPTWLCELLKVDSAKWKRREGEWNVSN